MLRRILKRSLEKLPLGQYEPFNFIEISTANLVHNLRYFQENNKTSTIIPVIKSNAYGHGIKVVSQILDEAGVKLVAVDGYFEARIVLDFTRCDVLVMGAIKPSNIKLLNTKRCSYVVQDIAGLKAFASLNKLVKIHLEINTGMNRLGLNSSEIDGYLDYLKKYPLLHLDGVMSHLADADNAKNDFTTKQLDIFEKNIEKILQQGYKPSYIHLAQTAGSVKVNCKYLNTIRLGIGLYGINPLQPADAEFDLLNKLKPVLELKSTIIKVQNLQEGDKVSYNGIFTAKRPMRVGILPLGYYEGYSRNLSDKGTVTYGSEVLPVVGRICMNHTMVDLTTSHADIHSVVTLISSDETAPNSIANICKEQGLFSYQLVTGLTEKIKRTVV